MSKSKKFEPQHTKAQNPKIRKHVLLFTSIENHTTQHWFILIRIDIRYDTAHNNWVL